MRKSILIFLFALLGIFSAHAYNFYVDGIYYNIISGTDDQVEVTSGSVEYSGAVVIPSTVENEGTTYSVTSIGIWAFSFCSGLTSVTIPNSVTSIGSSAFSACEGLTSVTIPNSVTSIGRSAFSGCSGLTSVTIPNSVTSIGESAFWGCSGLTSVTIPESVTTIGERAFDYCSGLTSITIPESVDSIGKCAFSYCTGLTSITIPVGSIGVWAFRGCSGLTSVTIGENVTSIGYGAFYNCGGLTSVQWNAVACQNFSYTSPFGEWDVDAGSYITSLTSITFGKQVERIPARLCRGCSGLTSVTIPESVTEIGECAFSYCTGLTSVTIPESVTSIGAGAFSETSISNPVYNSKIFAYLPQDYSGEYEIPSGIQLIAGDAFYYCSGLTSVTIPESVTSIGMEAFWNCSGLTSVTIPESVTSIGEDAFYDCSSLTSVVWNARHCADFTSSPFPPTLTSITFGKQVERIPAHLCRSCSGLTSVTIQEEVYSIGAYAFYKCSRLAEVTLPESVTYIGEKAFDHTAIGSPLYNTTVFARLPEDYTGGYTIPNGIQWIMDGAFSGCGGLTWLAKIPESVIAIGAQAFYGCKGLKSITLPSLLDTIGKYAFAFCDSLVSVISLSKNPPYCKNDDRKGAGTFSVYETLYVPRGSKAAYQAAPVWRDFANIKEIETEGTHLVTVQPNDTTMGRVTGGGEYSVGEQIILEATPEEGYHFVKWDDENTDNPRTLTVIADITLTAIFAQDNPTANENSDADNFGVYVQNRTIYLSEDRGLVQVYNMAGQCVYNGHATAIPVPQSGVYILRVADGRSLKVLVK